MLCTLLDITFLSHTGHDFFARSQPPETKVTCSCGWEEFVGKGIQEGYIGKVQGRYGFITKDYPRGRSPTGIYFQESELKGYSIRQLNIGDRVHFVVGQNDKGCIAQQIDVQGNNQFVPQVRFHFVCSHSLEFPWLPAFGNCL